MAACREHGLDSCGFCHDAAGNDWRSDNSEGVETKTRPAWGNVVAFGLWLSFVAALYAMGKGEPILVLIAVLWAILGDFEQSDKTEG